MQPPPAFEAANGIQLSALERASGFVLGRAQSQLPLPDWPRFARQESCDPRATLERIVLDHLGNDPSIIQFSGGRDSSLVLAIAAHVAQLNGLPLPRALSVRYPGYDGSNETHWQELVTQHLGIELETIVVPPQADELVSPLAVDLLVRDGPVFPPAGAVSLARLTPAVRGSTVLTGEGGDNVLGAEKITAVRAYLRQRVRPEREIARTLFVQSVPRPLRRWLIARESDLELLAPWLRAGAAAQVRTEIAMDQSDQSWDWRRATWSFVNYRMWNGGADLSNVAAREGFVLAHPLADPRFVEALCRRGGPLGYTNRTAIMRMLAADLLPDELLTRPSKAQFNEVYAGDAVRAFAREWDGAGVDHELVDPEALRRAWLSEAIAPNSLVPLQYAVLEAVRRGWRPNEGPKQ